LFPPTYVCLPVHLPAFLRFRPRSATGLHDSTIATPRSPAELVPITAWPRRRLRLRRATWTSGTTN